MDTDNHGLKEKEKEKRKRMDSRFRGNDKKTKTANHEWTRINTNFF